MKNILPVLLFLVLQYQSLFAQDTLLFRNGEKRAVIVSEIDPDNIKYTRFGTEAPQYIQSKTEIVWIKYKNGSVDSIKVTAVNKSISAQGDSPKLEIVDGKIYDQKGAVNENKLWVLICNYPETKTKEQLTVRYKELQKMDKQKLAWFLGGLGSAYVSYYSGIFVAESGTDNLGAVPVLIVALGGAGASIYYFVKIRKKIRKKRVEFVSLYNSQL